MDLTLDLTVFWTFISVMKLGNSTDDYVIGLSVLVHSWLQCHGNLSVPEIDDGSCLGFLKVKVSPLNLPFQFFLN